MVDLTPFTHAMSVYVGCFAVVFMVLEFIPGATSQEIGKSK